MASDAPIRATRPENDPAIHEVRRITSATEKAAPGLRHGADANRRYGELQGP